MFIFFLHWHLNRFSAGFNQLTWAAYLPLFALIVSSQILLRFNVEKFFILSTNGSDQHGRSADFCNLSGFYNVRAEGRSLMQDKRWQTCVCTHGLTDKGIKGSCTKKQQIWIRQIYVQVPFRAVGGCVRSLRMSTFTSPFLCFMPGHFRSAGADCCDVISPALINAPVCLTAFLWAVWPQANRWFWLSATHFVFVSLCVQYMSADAVCPLHFPS